MMTVELVVVCVVAGLGALLGIGFPALFGWQGHRQREREIKQIVQLGYDVFDVSVFVHSIGNTFTDFLQSPGLRAQYDLFRQGGSSDYQQRAKATRVL